MNIPQSICICIYISWLVEVQLQLVASSGSAPLPTPGTSGKPDTQTHRLSSRLAKWTKRPKNQTFRTLSVVVSGGKKELGQSDPDLNKFRPIKPSSAHS